MGVLRAHRFRLSTSVFGMIAVAWFLIVVVRTAWQCDDAYIAFRTAENLIAGRGAVWNPGERVQVFTSPSWMLVAACLRGLIGEVYFSVLLLSILLATACCGAIAFRLAGSRLPGAVVVVAMSLSAAIVEYSTSGLENPLLYCGLVALVFAARTADPNVRLLRISLSTSLLMLTRMDAVLFALPLLFWAARQSTRDRAAAPGAGRLAFLRPLILGLAPWIAWEVVSAVYYGTFVPNTAIAKLNVRIPPGALLAQGGRYLADSLEHDPVTLLLIAAACLVVVWKGTVRERLLAGGLVLYLLYVLRIGGDFMSGRFLSAPGVLAAVLLATTLRPEPRRTGRVRVTGSRPRGIRLAIAVVALAVLAYGLFWPRSPWTSGPGYGSGWTKDRILAPSGIANERAYYYPATGLLRVLGERSAIRAQGLPTPPYRGARLGLEFSKTPERVKVVTEVGFFGYFAGCDKTIVDVWALGDPLLARLPFRPSAGGWRIGHFPRRIPSGYVETLASGEDRFTDRGLADVYAAIEAVTRGPLFAARRWREIWRLQTGAYRPILERAGYE